MLCIVYLLYYVNKHQEKKNTVNLLNAKWKVVPARNSGWKKSVPI